VHDTNGSTASQVFQCGTRAADVVQGAGQDSQDGLPQQLRQLARDLTSTTGALA
jgi:hypothetical protein